jgi:putative spermidine/putrescine transport system substrate-binding protein
MRLPIEPKRQKKRAKEKKMKKLLLVAFSFMLIVLMTVSLGAKGQEEASTEEITTITFVDTDAGANIQLLFKEIVIPLAEKQENIKVDYVVSKGPEMLERVKGWGDKPGDIALFHVKPSDATSFFDAGIPLVKLTDNMDTIPNLTKVNKEVMNKVLGVEINGRSTSMFRFTMALLYNSEKIPNPPKSWKEFYERRSEWNGHIGMIRPDAKSSGGRRTFYSFFEAYGVDFSKPLEEVMKSQEWKSAVQKFEDFSGYLYNPVASEAPILFQQFKDGEVWLTEYALDYTLSSRDLGLLPETVKGALLSEGHTGGANAYFLVPSNNDEEIINAALKFINIALSNEVQQKMAERFYLYPSTDISDDLPDSLWEIVPPLGDLNTQEIKSNEFINYIKEQGMSYIKQ